VTLADTPTMELVVRCHMVLAHAATFASPSKRASVNVAISADSLTRVRAGTVGVEEVEVTSSAAVDLLSALPTRRASVSVAQAADSLTSLEVVMVVLLPTLAQTTPAELAHAMLSSVESVIVATLAAFLTVAMAAEWAVNVVLLAFATSSKLVNAREVIRADILTIPMLSSVLLRTLVPRFALPSRKVNALVVISADILTPLRVIKWVHFKTYFITAFLSIYKVLF